MALQNQLIIIILIFLTLTACNNKPVDPLLEPIVSIESSTLTKKELYDAIPSKTAKEDSIIFAQNYIDRWIKTQLILRKAELNLSQEEKNLDKLINDYRTSLLTHLYQQKLLEQKYSPLITSGEIREYYNTMIDNFKLNEIIIKGVFIKIEKTAPNISQIEKWYTSDNKNDLISLEAYCFQNAKKYDPFFDHWVPFEKINSELPEKITNSENVLKWKKSFANKDDQYNYYLSIKEILFIGETAPIEYVNDRIKSILLNKKRIDFINQLEKDLVIEGEKQKIIKFH
ncbi:MAG: hypothetical protein JW717_11735 [Marinilabiliaceae bacterium]|nr:hypothetical protein [Marinilabiliaceae bacterium]